MLRVVLTNEHRFLHTPSGTVWAQVAFAYPYWTRYLEVFDSVRIVARSRQVTDAPDNWHRVDGKNVTFTRVPHYIGPLQFALRSRRVKNVVRRSFHPDDALIMRVPTLFAACLEQVLYRSGHPYGVEVVGDPYDVFAPGALRHPLRRFFRWLVPRQLRRQCRHACAAAYVTEEALQQRYPPASDAFSTHCSTIHLPASAIVSQPRRPTDRHRFRLAFVGTLQEMYKAPDILLDAVGICVRAGLDLDLVMVGDGKHRGELESRASARGLEDRVDFLGQIPAGNPVREQLDKADLFVLPSLTEGLPRAMIEAMARALPCIGSTAGGIPELLAAEDLVPPGDAQALAAKITEVVTGDPQRMSRMSARNLEEAWKYEGQSLLRRRIVFYRHVKDRTQEWLASKRR